jgi:hypothetical protein
MYPESWSGVASVEHAKNLHAEDFFCFQAIPQNQTHPEVVRRQFDLNPLDFFAWEFTLAKLGCTEGMPLTKIRDEMPQQLVHAACMSFEKRCRAVVKERRARFEPTLHIKSNQILCCT